MGKKRKVEKSRNRKIKNRLIEKLRSQKMENNESHDMLFNRILFRQQTFEIYFGLDLRPNF